MIRDDENFLSFRSTFCRLKLLVDINSRAMNIRGRLRDWRHERRILRLKAICLREHDIYDIQRARARASWKDMVDAINQRSPEQVARMDRRLGL